MSNECKLARKRLILTDLGKKLSRAYKACRINRVSRMEFYEVERFCHELGREGLIVKPPIGTAHYGENSQAVKNKSKDISSKAPTIGRQPIGDQLNLEGVYISATSVRKVWIREKTGTHYERLLQLEDKYADTGLQCQKINASDWKSQALLLCN